MLAGGEGISVQERDYAEYHWNGFRTITSCSG